MIRFDLLCLFCVCSTVMCCLFLSCCSLFAVCSQAVSIPTVFPISIYYCFVSVSPVTIRRTSLDASRSGSPRDCARLLVVALLCRPMRATFAHFPHLQQLYVTFVVLLPAAYFHYFLVFRSGVASIALHETPIVFCSSSFTEGNRGCFCRSIITFMSVCCVDLL